MSDSDLPEDVYRLLEMIHRGTDVMDTLRTGISYLAGLTYHPPFLPSHDGTVRLYRSMA